MSKKQRVCTYQMRIRIVCTSFVIGIIQQFVVEILGGAWHCAQKGSCVLRVFVYTLCTFAFKCCVLCALCNVSCTLETICLLKQSTALSFKLAKNYLLKRTSTEHNENRPTKGSRTKNKTKQKKIQRQKGGKKIEIKKEAQCKKCGIHKTAQQFQQENKE